MEPLAEPVLETQPVAARFAGLWRRLAAWLVDTLVLAAIGFPLGLLLGERFAPIGTPARLLGLLVAVPYLGILGSEIGNGQTLGKRLLRLRVVDADGRCLPASRAFVRALLISLPGMINGVTFRLSGPVAVAALWVTGVLVLGLGGATLGTVLLNRPTRQGLHDLLVGSYVVEAGRVGLPVAASSTRRPMVASAVWIALVAAGATAMVVWAPALTANETPPVLFDRVASIPGVNSMQVKTVTTWRAGGTSKVVSGVVCYGGRSEDVPEAARQVAAAMLDHYADAASAPTVGVTVVRGWDVGVARLTHDQNFVHTPEQWRAELGR
ncbi:RDD family protein [Anaeromyxobacter sp. PSR-1]|uniref:RDD family protein n=1 Tax=Anaeromyxobacter sp. PSR-1 TaxID=1300915 RepID=UPI0005DD03A0|nr:RDD family protein [Anaeromyxobacter sp. PSR-1]GAO03083.1 RDD family protein [Anaeromyxobacter sp. PSR-1]